MVVITKEYDAKTDVKKRITLRDSVCRYYHVVVYSDGRILLEPGVPAKPFEISEKTLAMMDRSMENFKQGKVSAPIDLSSMPKTRKW